LKIRPSPLSQVSVTGCSGVSVSVSVVQLVVGPGTGTAPPAATQPTSVKYASDVPCGENSTISGLVGSMVSR
jgi:hypothetical protein